MLLEIPSAQEDPHHFHISGIGAPYVVEMFLFSGESQERRSAVRVVNIYRWLWKARGKIFCPRHGVSFSGASHSKNQSLCAQVVLFVRVTCVLIFPNKAKAASC